MTVAAVVPADIAIVTDVDVSPPDILTEPRPSDTVPHAATQAAKTASKATEKTWVRFITPPR